MMGGPEAMNGALIDIQISNSMAKIGPNYIKNEDGIS